MASEIQKTDIAYKRFSKKEYTSTIKKWHEEYPAKALNVKFADIWVDEIPYTPPVSGTAVVQVVTDLILTEDITVDASLSWVACSSHDDLNTRIGDFIQPDQDIPQAYYIKLFDNTGTQIYVGDNVGWEFDYANGVMTFEQPPAFYEAPFHLTGYRYIGKKGSKEAITPTLDDAYDGFDGDGTGKVIYADFGPVTIEASAGSAALQINPITYTPSTGLEEGQIVNNGGILYVYDSTRMTWISMIRQNVIFGSKRADGRFLNMGDFSSTMSGWPAMRQGIITGITAHASSGYPQKEFRVILNNNPTHELAFNLTNYYYANGNINIPFQASDLIKILASSEFAATFNTIISLEIGWVI